MGPDADRARRPTLESRYTPVNLKKLPSCAPRAFGIFYALHANGTGRRSAMTTILGPLIAAIFAAIALLAWVTVPT
jgi:hypothetical protein